MSDKIKEISKMGMSKQFLFLTFPNVFLKEKEFVSFFWKKRKEQKRYFVDHSIEITDEGTLVCFDLYQLKSYFNEKTRLDLFVMHKDQNDSYRVSINDCAQQTKLKPTRFNNELYIIPYITKNRKVSILIDSLQNINSEMFEGFAILKRIAFNKKNLILKIKVNSEEKTHIKGLVVKHRKGTKTINIIAEKLNNKGNIMTISFDTTNYSFEKFYWDFFVEVETSDMKSILLRVKNFSLWNKFKLQYLYAWKTNRQSNGYLLMPYITESEELSIKYRSIGKYESKRYKFNECIAFFLYLLFGIWFVKAKIWLIHEKYSETAQDNSFNFFKYCYENHPEKRVFFVIKKDSKDYGHVIPYKDRVVHFMSIKHLFLILVARRIVSSESKGHGFAWRVTQGIIKPHLNQKRFVFLQHGVLGLKKIDNTFRANGNNHADLFVASSDFEKEIIYEYLGYPKKNIIVTGLARWDYLDSVEKTVKKEILCMPTWRNWLEEVSDSEFLASDYFSQYYQLITSKELCDFLVEKDIYMNFYLHPKFIQFANLFESTNEHIRIIQFGQKTVHELIKMSSMLITDYSSVAWEFYYLNKPVLFYHFDRNEYERLQGSYMNLETDLFGEISTDMNSLIKNLKDCANRNMTLSESALADKEKYFKYVDRNNCERIYHEIIKLEEQTSWVENVKYSLKRNPMVRTLWKKLVRNNS